VAPRRGSPSLLAQALSGSALQESVELAGQGALGGSGGSRAGSCPGRCGGWWRPWSAHDGSGGASRWWARPAAAAGPRPDSGDGRPPGPRTPGPGPPRQHGQGGLGAEPARMGPADHQLGSADGADPGLAEQGRGHDHDQLAQLSLQLLGVLSGGQDPLGGQAKCPRGGPVLHRITRQGHQPGADLLAPRGAPAGGLAAARGR
jgi:hypothetical protein